MENLLERNPESSPIAAYMADSYEKASDEEVSETPQVFSHWREEGDRGRGGRAGGVWPDQRWPRGDGALLGSVTQGKFPNSSVSRGSSSESLG